MSLYLQSLLMSFLLSLEEMGITSEYVRIVSCLKNDTVPYLLQNERRRTVNDAHKQTRTSYGQQID